MPLLTSGLRNSLAKKLGTQLVACFSNLETFLNLEFELGNEEAQANISTESIRTPIEQMSSNGI